MIRPVLQLIRKGQLTTLIRSGLLFKPYYKIVYIAAAKECGLLDLLNGRHLELEQILCSCCENRTDTKTREAFEAWLQLGLGLGLIEFNSKGYGLKGIARQLAMPKNDAFLGLFQEAAGLHHRLISITPQKLRLGELWQLGDQDGQMIARSSRSLEVFQIAAIDRLLLVGGPVRLLEIGCGSGFYMAYAARRNPELSAVGVELQASVAAAASQNIRDWRLQDRIRIETLNIWDLKGGEKFDVATLFNNIYYFPVEERVALLQHIRTLLQETAVLLVTSFCQGGSVGAQTLNLWGAATSGSGRLPRVDEMVDQLRDAGYLGIETIKLIPTDSFYAFRAHVA